MDISDIVIFMRGRTSECSDVRFESKELQVFFVWTFIELLDRKIESHGTYIYNPNEQTLYMTQSQMLQKNLCDLPAKF